MADRPRTCWNAARVVGLSLLAVTQAFAQGRDEASHPKTQFVEGLRAVLEAVVGHYGNERPLLRSGLDRMRLSLTRWDALTAARRRAVDAESAGDSLRLAEAHRALAIVYLDRDRLEEGIDEITAATKVDPSRADDWLLLGLALHRAGRTSDAMRALNECTGLDDANLAGLYLLATELRTTGESDRADQTTAAFVRSATPLLRTVRATSSTPPFPAWGLGLASADVDPLFVPTRYAEAVSRLKEGRYRAAIQSFDEAADADALFAGAPVAARMSEGAAAFRHGDLSGATTLLQSAIDLAPENAEAHRLLGLALRASGQRPKSISELQTAVRLDSYNERARVALAAALQDAGQFPEAEAVLRDTVSVFPTSGEAHYSLAQVDEARHAYANARLEYERALSLGPVVDTEPIYRRLARLPRSVETDEQRLERATERARLFLNSAEAHTDLGADLLELNRGEEATAEFLVAVLIDPRHVEAYAHLAQAFLRAGNSGDAEAAARRALSLNPSHAGARYALATALARQGKTDEAKIAFDQYRAMLAEAETNRHRDFALRRLMAQVRASVDQGDLDEGIRALRAAIRLTPDDAALHVSVGAFLMNAGRYDEAIESLERALVLHAGPQVHVYLADAYDAVGRRREAEAQRRLAATAAGRP